MHPLMLGPIPLRNKRSWLARPDCRIKLHYVPAYCPLLNPIERLWGLMHKHITHTMPNSLVIQAPTSLASRARQGLGDPGLQFLLLLRRQPATATPHG
jgi:hypothetical protein